MRLKNKFRVSVKREDGRTVKMELVPLPFTKKFLVRVNGKNSDSHKTLSEFFNDLRKWFVNRG